MSYNLILNMGTAFRGSMDHIRGGMSETEKISTLALSILTHIDQNPDISQGQLARILRRDPMTMSQAVRALQNAGLVTSEQDSYDRRIKRLSITKKGRVMAESLRDSETSLINSLTRKWGKSRVNQFTRDVVEFNEFLTMEA